MRQVKHFVFVVFCICNLLATCFSVKQSEDSGHREESATCSIPTETDSTPATCSAPSTTVSEVPNHNAEFVATNDWQELLQGQSVPPGLHVRVNLQTGKREAKLLDANEKEADNAAVLVDSPDEGSEGVLQTSASAVGEVKEDHEATDKSYDNVEILNESESFVPKEPDWNHEKMYELLNSLPEPPKVGNMDINEAQKKLSKDEFRREIIRLWKNRQADLKLALDALQNDSKYQGELIDSFHEAGLEGKVEEQLVILEKLEWEVQDLDKTHIFHYIGGFDFVLEQLNASDLRIAASACWVIGTACKYYDDAQVWAIDAGVMPRLLQQLAVESSITSDNQDQQLSIWEARKKALYAITSIMRSQDRARKLFLQFDGKRALGQFFGGSAPYNVQIKALFLVHDTLVEAESKKSEIASHPALSKLDEAFKTGEWCERVVNFYETFHENLVPSHLIEALETLTAQADMCSSVFQQAKLRAQLDKQIANWEKMKLAESDEELTHVLKAARTLIETLKSSETSHEEL